MIDTKSLRPGQPVYVDTGYGFRHGTVVKVTPTGCVDVQYTNHEEVTRFRPDGSIQGGSRWEKTRLDLRFTFEERTKLIEKDVRKKQVIPIIQKIVVNGRLNWQWSVDDLKAEVTRLETMCQEVRAELEKL